MAVHVDVEGQHAEGCCHGGSVGGGGGGGGGSGVVVEGKRKEIGVGYL